MSGIADLVRALRARRGAALLVTLLATGALALYGAGLRLEEDLLAFLPSDDPTIAEHARAFRAFKALETMRVDLGPAESGERLAKAADAFEHELAVSPLVSRVFAGVREERGAEIALELVALAGRSLPALAGAEEIAPVL